ncbi:MAG TPA: STAS domain-containing protein [Streptosporangiaceae bacterium]
MGRVGLRLDGEADMSTQDQLRQALAELPVDKGVVHLELGGLRFIDVICTRELMTLTARHPDLRLALHSPPVMLRHMISLLWPDSNVEICPATD